MTAVGECFDVAVIGGVTAYGAFMTRWGTSGYMYHTHGAGAGWAAPIPPTLLKKQSMLTLSGQLAAGVLGRAAAICAANGPWNAPRTVTPVTCEYGGVGSDIGWSTADCIGARLNVSGRSNALVTFSLDMIGGITIAGGVNAGDPAAAEFYPTELCTCSLGVAMGFDFTMDAGLGGLWPMVGDNEAWTAVVDKGASATLRLIVTDPGVNVGDENVLGSVTLGEGGGSIAVTGTVMSLDRETVEGVLCCGITISGVAPTFVSIG